MDDFKDYIVKKLLNLGFIIYGGYVRDTFLKTLKNTISYYKSINDIDCICSIHQFNELMSTEMKKYSDISFSFKKTTCSFLDNVVDQEYVTHYSGFVISRINNSDRTYIDLLVCNINYISQLVTILSRNIDFVCNKLCIQKINSIESYSLLNSLDNITLFTNTISLLNNLIAQKNNNTDNYRIQKMMSYGFKVDIGFVTSRFISENYTMYIFLQDCNERCIICNNTLSVSNVFIDINNKVMHFSCYVSKSIEIFNNINAVDISRESILTNIEKEQTKEPIKVDTVEANTSSEAVEPELLNFIKFTKSKEEKLETTTEESDITIVNNTVFMGGIAMEPTFHELILTSREVITQIAELYYLCTSEKKIIFLIELEDHITMNNQ